MSERSNKRPRTRSAAPAPSPSPSPPLPVAAAAAAVDNEEDEEVVVVPDMVGRPLNLGILSGEEETQEILRGFGFSEDGIRSVIRASKALLGAAEDLRHTMMLYTDRALSDAHAVQKEQMEKGLIYISAIEALAAAEAPVLPHTDSFVYVFAPRNTQCFCRRRISPAWFLFFCEKSRWSPFFYVSDAPIRRRTDAPADGAVVVNAIFSAVEAGRDIVLRDRENNWMRFSDLEAEQFLVRPFLYPNIGTQF